MEGIERHGRIVRDGVSNPETQPIQQYVTIQARRKARR
jgi:hypothetical protein